jgi:anaerobic selenocysteine-containing dehydrogenase
MLKPSDVSFERLEREQIVYATSPIQYEKYLEHGFNTPSGKVEFSSSSFEKSGYPAFPSYTEPAGEPLHSEDIAEKGCSLLGTTQRLPQFVHTKFRNLETLVRLYPEPLVLMHPVDASDRGIAEGEEVEVSSPTGKIRLKATLTEDTSPGLVWIDFGWGNPTDGKANINVLVNDAFVDPVSGGTPNRLFACEVNAI